MRTRIELFLLDTIFTPLLTPFSPSSQHTHALAARDAGRELAADVTEIDLDGASDRPDARWDK